MSLDIIVLRGAINAVNSAAVLTSIGRDADALRDVNLAIELLQGAVRDDYESACRDGVLIVDERLLNSENDLRPSDDGEDRA